MTEAIGDFMFLIGIALILATILGELFEQSGLSGVLGEVSAGIIIGPLILNISTPESIAGLAEIGIVLLLFVVATEIHFEEIQEMGRNLVQITIFDLVSSLLLGIFLGVFLGLGDDWRTPIFLGLAFSATSLGISVRTLEGMEESHSIEGRTIIGVAVLDDVLALFALLLISMLVLGGDPLDIIISSLLVMVFILVMIFLLPEVFQRSQWITERAQSREFSIGIILGLILVVSYIAQETGLAMALGAFLLGISLRKAPAIVEEIGVKVRVLANVFFIPIFFIFVGMSLQISIEIIGITTLVIVLGALVIKILGVMAGAITSQMSPISSLRVAAGMLPRAEVTLVIAQLALVEAIFDTTVFSAMILLVFISTFLTPIILKVTFMGSQKVPIP